MDATSSAGPSPAGAQMGWITLGPSGEYEDANEAALRLLGFSLDQLRALPPGSLSTTPPAEAAALRAEWDRLSPESAVGESTVRRADGSPLRVRFTLLPQADGRYRASLEPVAGGVDQPIELYTMGDVLSEWRAAERRLTEVTPDSAEWADLHRRIEELRGEHQRRFGERNR